MQSMTIEQLRAASDAGGVSDVTLKGQGGAFLVQIATRSGAAALLAKARSSGEARVSLDPRRRRKSHTASFGVRWPSLIWTTSLTTSDRELRDKTLPLALDEDHTAEVLRVNHAAQQTP